MAGEAIRRLTGTSPLQTSRATRNAGSGGRDTLNGRMKTNREGALALGAAFTKATQTKRQYLAKMDKLKAFYLVDAILGAIIEDALTPDISTGEVVEVTSPNSAINTKLKKLQKSLDFDQIIKDIAPDLVMNGEYTLAMEVDKTGVTDIKDSVSQEKIVAFYEKGYPSQFLVEGKNDIIIAKPIEYAHFVMGEFKMRLKVSGFLDEKKFKKVQDKLPSYARVGKPLFYGTASKITELQLLEALVPAAKLSEITRGSIVGVSVPGSTSPDKAFEIARKYEQIFNGSQGLDHVNGDISITDVIAVAGRVKALPVFSDKGGIDPIGDAKNNRSVDDILGTINDLRNVICTSIGFPPELLFGGDSKAELLKRYARYLRRLKSVQTALAMGIKQICLAHLMNEQAAVDAAKGTKVTSINKDVEDKKKVTIDDIDVRFRNELVNIDELEKLEYSDAMVSTMAQIFEFIETLANNESMAEILDADGVHTWLYSIFRLISPVYDIIVPPEGDDKKAKPIPRRHMGKKKTAKGTPKGGPGEEPGAEEEVEPEAEPAPKAAAENLDD